MINTPVLITSVLRTSAITSNKLTSFEDRLQQTKNAFQNLLDEGIFKNFVIVDGSNEEVFSEYELQNFREKYSVNIEQLFFLQNINEVRLFGKSIGEIEIVNYAVKFSCLIAQHGCFFKISGRYKIRNIKTLAPKLDRYKSAFYFDNSIAFNNNRQFVTTIFYKTTVNFYNINLAGLSNQCNIYKNGYLESIYYRVLVKRKKSAVSISYPKYDAISGTTGSKTVNRFYLIRNLFSRIGLICFRFE